MVRPARHRYYALLAAGALAAPLAVLTSGAPRRDIRPPPQLESTQGNRIEGLQTVLAGPNGLRLLASARSIQVESPRALGPLRVGFMRSIVASGLEVVLLANAVDPEQPLDLTSSVKSVGAAFTRHSSLIASFEVEGLTIMRSDANGTVALLRARRCRTDAQARLLVCRKGVLRVDDVLVPFSEAVHDGRQWRITKGATKPARMKTG